MLEPVSKIKVEVELPEGKYCNKFGYYSSVKCIFLDDEVNATKCYCRYHKKELNSKLLYAYSDPYSFSTHNIPIEYQTNLKLKECGKPRC